MNDNYNTFILDFLILYKYQINYKKVIKYRRNSICYTCNRNLDLLTALNIINIIFLTWYQKYL